MAKPRAGQGLLDNLEEALEMLRDHGEAPFAGAVAEPLPSLLEQCVALGARALPPQPLRSLHHMACTGGTLICKCLAVMPNVTLLSEIDPLSRMALPPPGRPPTFRPTDLIYSGLTALRPLDEATVERVFLAALRELHGALSERGQYLCLRDHAHSQFCTRVDPDGRPTLLELLRKAAPGGAEVRAAVTVRHPFDSFLALVNNAWLHFTPATPEEYARRYLLFLDRHAGLELVRYEDFVAAPEAVLERLCATLELPYMPGAESLIPVVALSGDSGRRSDRIAPRPRRAVSQTLLDEARRSPSFRVLCDRLGYDDI
jgi:hypothetical protein